jgi:hypothetical protein
MSAFDHVANGIVALCTALGVCGGFAAWVLASRTKNRDSISAQIARMILAEKTEREEDVGGMENAIAQLSQRVGQVAVQVGECAKASDLGNIYRLIEKLGDDARAAHQSLQTNMAGQITEMAKRVDRILEQRATVRVVPREQD